MSFRDALRRCLGGSVVFEATIVSTVAASILLPAIGVSINERQRLSLRPPLPPYDGLAESEGEFLYRFF